MSTPAPQIQGPRPRISWRAARKGRESCRFPAQLKLCGALCGSHGLFSGPRELPFYRKDAARRSSRRESPEPFRYRRQSGFPSHSRYGDPYCRAAVPPQRGYAAQIGKWRRLLPSSGPNYAHAGQIHWRAACRPSARRIQAPAHRHSPARATVFRRLCARLLPSVR